MESDRYACMRRSWARLSSLLLCLWGSLLLEYTSVPSSLGGFKVTDTNGGPGGKAVPGFLQMVPELGRRGAHGHLETQVAVDKLHSNARLSLFGHPGTEGRASPAQLASRAASEALCVITVQTSAIMSGGSSGLTEGPALHHQA